MPQMKALGWGYRAGVGKKWKKLENAVQNSTKREVPREVIPYQQSPQENSVKYWWVHKCEKNIQGFGKNYIRR
jgi:hypothetical protein